MQSLKSMLQRLLPYFPFIVLTMAVFVVIYHIKVYW